MIVESLALISAANSAFEVIKAALKNGKELADVGEKAFEYFGYTAQLQENGVEKAGGRPIEGRSDIMEFMALEKIRQQEEHLRESMIYAGRPGMWEDWQKFRAMAARKRREAKEAAELAAKKRQAEIQEIINACIIGGAVILVTGLVLFGIWGFTR